MFSVRVVSLSRLVPIWKHQELAFRRKTMPRSHDVDVHASDLVGIDGITRVLIVHIPHLLTTQHYIPKDRTLHNNRCENLKAYESKCVLYFYRNKKC
jgi:hypothetical protein